MPDSNTAPGDGGATARAAAVVPPAFLRLPDVMRITGLPRSTLYRLMAEHIVDAMCEQMGDTERKCRTADEPVPGSENRKLYQVTQVDAGAVSAVRLKGTDSRGSFWVYPGTTMLRLVEPAGSAANDADPGE